MVYYSLFEKMMKERAKKEDPFGFSVYFRAAPEYNGGNEGGQETMKIAGLQKTTLLDYPGKVACTVFLAGCNFRCPYCQNAEIAFAQGGEDIPPEELLAFLRRRRGILDGVCVTGGEPLVHTRIGELLRKIKALGYAVKLDTNGSFPARLKALCAEGLVDFVAMDIKHAPAQYARAAGVPADMDAIGESAAFLLGGSVPYELRTTVARGLHTAADMEEIGRWLRGAKRYYLQNFRPGDTLPPGCTLEPFSDEEMLALKRALAPFIPAVRIRGEGE